MASYTVAITGASGAVYGLRLIEELINGGSDVDVIISPTAFLILEHETGLAVKGGDGGGVADALKGWIEARGKNTRGCGRLNFYPCAELTAPIASGSSLTKTMIVCPCSMGTLSRIACGTSGNLIERAADCVLKERGRLVLVPRETPLNEIHLENMLKLTRMGAVVVPAMPGFYSKPGTIDDMVDFIVGKVLDVVDVENNLYKRWEGGEGT